MDQTLFDKLKTELMSLGHLTPTGEKITTVKGAADTLFAGITVIEKLAADAAGIDKKDLVMTVISQFVHIPFVPQFVVNDVASVAIDAVVGFLNSHFGTDWFTKLIG